MTPQHSVTVVIPTLGRDGLRRALASVRRQTHPARSTIVVLDDASRVEAVRGLLDQELLVVTSGGTGAANARNLGVAEARSDFVAFLDDDDWWEPEKLALQISDLLASGGDVSYTETVFHETDGDVRVLPVRQRRRLESVASYLVTRPRLKHGTGYIQTSALLARTELLRTQGWDPALRKHQDWDLIARLAAQGHSFAFLPQPLVHVQQGSVGSISKSADWRASKVWLERHGFALDRRSRGDFAATQLLRSAASTRDGAGVVVALNEMIRHPPHLAAVLVGLHGFLER